MLQRASAQWSRGESNPPISCDSSLQGGCDAQIDAQDLDPDGLRLAHLVNIWPALEEWRKRAMMELAQPVPVSKPQHGQDVSK